MSLLEPIAYHMTSVEAVLYALVELANYQDYRIDTYPAFLCEVEEHEKRN
jgi:hypothetical protein